jgi:hypothetical protein
MEILHKAKEPSPLIRASLLETLPRRSLLIRSIRELVLLHARVSKLLLALVEPVGREGSVREKNKANERDETSRGTLDDEEPGMGLVWGCALGVGDLPSPSLDSLETVHTGKDTSGNESRETGSKDLSAVEKGDSRGDLCLGH